MKKLLFILIAILSIYVQAGEVFKFTGTAYDLKDNQILYTEYHTQFFDENNNIEHSQVFYKNNEGEKFAEKDLRFLKEKTTPNLKFNDARTGTRIDVVVENNQASLKYSSGEKSIDQSIKLKNISVIDAGFDQLLLDRWDDLIKGNSVRFHFLAPTRGELIDFRVIQRDINRDYLYLTLQPDSWLLRMLVEDIKLKYSRKTKRILEFKGLTNIEEVINGKTSDDYVTAKIKYEYLD